MWIGSAECWLRWRWIFIQETIDLFPYVFTIKHIFLLHCWFCVDQIVKWAFKLVWIPVVKTTKCSRGWKLLKECVNIHVNIYTYFLHTVSSSAGFPPFWSWAEDHWWDGTSYYEDYIQRTCDRGQRATGDCPPCWSSKGQFWHSSQKLQDQGRNGCHVPLQDGRNSTSQGNKVIIKMFLLQEKKKLKMVKEKVGSYLNPSHCQWYFSYKRSSGSKMASESGLVTVIRWKVFGMAEQACVCLQFCQRMRACTLPLLPISREMPSALGSSM